jgi:hypothetical protein
MNGRTFIDTDILVYACDGHDPHEQGIADDTAFSRCQRESTLSLTKSPPSRKRKLPSFHIRSLRLGEDRR